MIRLRYTAWDGTQRVRLTADEIVETFADYLSQTHDVQQALDWLVRHGLEVEGMRVVGLEEILEQVRTALGSRYAEFDIHSGMDALRGRLAEIVDLERDRLATRDREDGEAAAKRAFLDSLPSVVSQALERLRQYVFEDPQARAAFEELLQDVDDIRALEHFVRRYGDRFHGRQSISGTDAIALMHEIERLMRLEEELLAGDLEEVPEAGFLESLLGSEWAQHLITLRRVLTVLAGAGYLMNREGAVKLSAKGVRKIGQLALRDIYRDLMRSRGGRHAIDEVGTGEVQQVASRRYRFGDPLHLDLVQTLRNALERNPSTPLRLAPEDFESFETDDSTTCATVFLLDMSWSMSWDGRFAAAKKVALAMESLVRTRYPRDVFAIVGFFTRARELKLADLPEASWNAGEPFTNLQDGLRAAREILARHSTTTKHIILITDGQPTAYFRDGRLYCEWPLSFGGISLRAAHETLKEVERVTRKGIVINTFMLDDSPALRAFVDRMTRINKGRAFYTRPDRLGEYLLVDYVARRRRRL